MCPCWGSPGPCVRAEAAGGEAATMGQAGPLLFNPLCSSVAHPCSLALRDFLLCCPTFLFGPCCPWERARKVLEKARTLPGEWEDPRHREVM